MFTTLGQLSQIFLDEISEIQGVGGCVHNFVPNEIGIIKVERNPCQKKRKAWLHDTVDVDEDK